MMNTLYKRLEPAPVGGGFAMEDYWIWCPSVVQDDKGLFHMFASRWPRSLTFSPHWLTNSEVVHATSPTAEGPYTFREISLPARGGGFWDGDMTHNPSIRRAADGTWLLFYTGTHYTGQRSTPDQPIEAGDPGNLSEMPRVDGRVTDAHRHQRIGLATAPSPEGPWTRRDAPILEPRPGRWDNLMTTNPAPCVASDGSILLLYKSVWARGEEMKLGAAQASHYKGPYNRLSEEPILHFQPGEDVEDPYVWYEDGGYHLIMKDMEGGIGVPRGGVAAASTDGIHWTLANQPKAYSRTIRWDDGTTSTQAFFERPSLLLDAANHPTHLFTATAIGSENCGTVTRSWNLVIPLA